MDTLKYGDDAVIDAVLTQQPGAGTQASGGGFEPALMQALFFNKEFYRSLELPWRMRLLSQTCKRLAQRSTNESDAHGAWQAFGLQTLLAAGNFKCSKVFGTPASRSWYRVALQRNSGFVWKGMWNLQGKRLISSSCPEISPFQRGVKHRANASRSTQNI